MSKWSCICLYTITVIFGTILQICILINTQVQNLTGNSGSAFLNILYIFYEHYSWSYFLFVLITYIYGMYLFVQKMLKFTKLRNEEQLSDQQARVLKDTSKYVSLLTIAIVTTIIAMISFVAFGFLLMDQNNQYMTSMGKQVATIIQSVDCTANIICLSLQYSFANKHYDKYCGCLNKICNKMFKIKLQTAAQKKYIETVKNLSEIIENGPSKSGVV